MNIFKSMAPGRIIAAGFCTAILMGTLLLLLPFSQTGTEQISFLDALFTATSATCVTGLVVVDTGTVWTPFGQSVILLLIQLGGLGAAGIGVAATMMLRSGRALKYRQLIHENWNLSGTDRSSQLLVRILLITFCCELLGAVLSFPIFIRDHSTGKALFLSLFHAVSAFNNAGFDLFGGMRSLTHYGDMLSINLLTAFLIIMGGLGYLVILELLTKRRWSRFSLQTKIVLSTTAVLLVGGTLLLKSTQSISWTGAFFQSVSARTAGFNSWDLAAFPSASLLVMCLLMFVGASPGSTGGGIKTTTLFTLCLSAKSASDGKGLNVFRRSLPLSVVSKAFTVTLIAVLFVLTSTFLLCCFEPGKPFMDLFFEAVSAFATVGLSITGTPSLGTGARIVLIFTMFIGRIGPLTAATLLHDRQNSAWSYSEEGITIG